MFSQGIFSHKIGVPEHYAQLISFKTMTAKNFTNNKLSFIALLAVVLLQMPACQYYTSNTLPYEDLDAGQTTAKTKSTESTIFSRGQNALPKADLLYELMAGEMAGKLGDLDQAAQHYSNAAKITDDPKTAKRATQIALHSKNTELTISAANHWKKLAPSDPQVYSTLGALYLGENDVLKATENLDTYIRFYKSSPDNGFNAISVLMFNAKESKVRQEVMSNLVIKNEKNAYAHFNHGNVALLEEDYKLAVKAANKALELTPGWTMAKTLRAKANFEDGNMKLALQDMKELVQVEPEQNEFRTTYARMLIEDGQLNESRKQFKFLLDKNPKNMDLVKTIALLNFNLEQYDEAKRYFKKLLAAGKDDHENNYYLGRVAEAQSRDADAISKYKKVYRGSHFLAAQIRVAELHYKSNSLEKAVDHLEKVRTSSIKEDIRVNLFLAQGELFFKSKNYQRGMNLYDRALMQYQDNSDLLYSRALMAEKIGRIDFLERDLNAILDKDPNHASALNALGYTWVDHDLNLEKGLEYIERALELRPEDPAIIDSMGWAHYKLGNYQQAEIYLRKAMSIFPDGEIAAHLIELMLSAGKNQEAYKVYNQAIELSPDDENLQKMKERLTL